VCSRSSEIVVQGAGHDCKTVREAGFEGFSNGDLLRAAEPFFDVLLTIAWATCSSANAIYRGNGANPVPPLGNGVRAMLSTMARNV
jgi:hypothetical protein